MNTIAGAAPFAVEGIVWEDDARLERESVFDAWEAPGPTKRPYFDRDVLDKTLADRLDHALAIVDAAEKFTATEDGCHALGKAIHDHAAAARGEEPKPVCANCNNANPPTLGGNRIFYRHPEVSTGFLCDQCHDADYRAKKGTSAGAWALASSACHDADYRAKKGTGPCPPGEKGTEGQPGKPGTWDYQGGSKFFIPSETGKPDELREAYERLGRAMEVWFERGGDILVCGEESKNVNLAWDALKAKRADPKPEECSECHEPIPGKALWHDAAGWPLCGACGLKSGVPKADHCECFYCKGEALKDGLLHLCPAGHAECKAGRKDGGRAKTIAGTPDEWPTE